MVVGQGLSTKFNNLAIMLKLLLFGRYQVANLFNILAETSVV